MKLLLASLIVLATFTAHTANIIDGAKYKSIKEASANCNKGDADGCYPASYESIKFFDNLKAAEKYMVAGCKIRYDKACRNWDLVAGHRK